MFECSRWMLVGSILWMCCQSTWADWPQWRGPQRDGRAPGPAFSADVNFTPVWKAQVGTGFSSIAVSDGRAITVGNQDETDTIYCLNVVDGSVLWKHSYAAPLDPNLFEGGPTATPTIHEDRVYAISRRGDVLCLNLATGEVHWRRQIVDDHGINIPSWGFAGSPLVLPGRVIVNAGAQGFCLDAHTGETLWQSDNSEDAGYTSPVLARIGETELVFLESGKSLTAVNPQSGARLWTTPWITRYGINAADPLVLSEGRVLVSSGYGKGTALVRFTPTDAEQVWRVRELKNQMSPGVLLDGTVLAFDGDAGGEVRLVAMDPESGEVRWTEDGFGAGTLIAVGRQLLILSDSGELVVADLAADGLRVLGRTGILTGKCWTPLAYADKTVFGRNAAGDVVAVQLE